jgi:TPR repeat protein
MEALLISKINDLKLAYVPVDDKSIEKIYKLYCENVIYKPNEAIEYFYLGVYHGIIKKDFDLMKKYYLMAIDLGNVDAMDNLGYYYQNTEKNYDLMKKYYLMAIDLGSAFAMNNLGSYYCDIIKEYDLMKKYFLMAIDLGHVTSMNNLARYYRYTEKDYDLMKKYFLMAIDLGKSDSMVDLGHYYCDIEKNYDLMKKYYSMAIDLGHVTAMNNLAYYYCDIEKNYDLMKKYYLMAIDLGSTRAYKLEWYYKINYDSCRLLKLRVKYQRMANRNFIILNINAVASKNKTQKEEKIFLNALINFEFNDNDNIDPMTKLLVFTIKKQVSLMKLHFDYSMNGPGFNNAKNDFTTRCVNH